MKGKRKGRCKDKIKWTRTMKRGGEGGEDEDQRKKRGGGGERRQME